MSSVLTATGPQATYGNAEGSSNGFPAAVVPVANSGVVMVGEGPFSFLALVVGRLPMALISVGAWGTDATWLPAIARRAPTTVSAVGTPRTSPLASSVRRLAAPRTPQPTTSISPQVVAIADRNFVSHGTRQWRRR